MSRVDSPWQRCRPLLSRPSSPSGLKSSSRSVQPGSVQQEIDQILQPDFFREIQSSAGHEWPSLLDRLQVWAAQRPEDVAFKTWQARGHGQAAESMSLTWSQLSQRLASSRLSSRRADPRPVVLALNNSGWAPQHIFEVWCADRCLIPLSISETEDRAVEILRYLPGEIDRRYSVDCSAEYLARRWKNLGFCSMSDTGGPGPKLAAAPQSEFGPEAESEKGSMQLWMNAVLTSGSTGFSKLVPQTQGQVFANAEALARRLQLRSGDRILTPLPLYHVNALNFSLLTSAMVGAEAHFTHALRLRSFLSTIAEVRPRFVSLIPPLLRQLQSCSEIELKAALRDTEALITAATALSPELYEFVVRKLGLRLLQGYGLSESVNFSCLMELHPQRPAEDFLSEITVEGESVSAAQRYVSIGSALEGTEVSIRDQKDRAVPEGQIGEICVRGFSTMNGYWNVKPEDQPIRSEWLRTGDLGFEKIPRDGPSIFFHAGRIKEVIKRSGETISLIEVDFKINRALATETGHQLRQQLESLGFLDFMAVGFSHSITGEELALVVRVDPRQVGELGREPWSEKSQSEWVKVFSALDVKFRPRVLLYVAEDFRTASGKPQRWKPKVELAPARDQIMTAVPLVLWSSSLTGAD